MSGLAEPDPVPTELVLFLAAHGGYKRVLGEDQRHDPHGQQEHRRDHYGRCGRCSSDVHPVAWPCILRTSALDAKELVKRWRAAGLLKTPVPEQRSGDDRHADGGAGEVVAPPPESSGVQGRPGGGGATDH